MLTLEAFNEACQAVGSAAIRVLRRPPRLRLDQNLQMLLHMFEDCAFFHNLKLQGIRLNVCRFLGVELLDADSVLFEQGAVGDKFYVIMMVRCCCPRLQPSGASRLVRAGWSWCAPNWSLGPRRASSRSRSTAGTSAPPTPASRSATSRWPTGGSSGRRRCAPPPRRRASWRRCRGSTTDG